MKNDKNLKAANILRTLIITLTILALVAITVFAFSHYNSLHKARLALYEAKTVRLAAWSVSIEYSATNIPFSDSTSATGFTKNAEEQIRELSTLKGTTKLLRTNKGGYEILSLSYQKDNYIVEYNDIEGKVMWQVYEKSALITA